MKKRKAPLVEKYTTHPSQRKRPATHVDERVLHLHIPNGDEHFKKSMRNRARCQDVRYSAFENRIREQLCVAVTVKPKGVQFES